MKQLLTLLILALTLGVSPAYGQFGDLKKKVKKEINKRDKETKTEEKKESAAPEAEVEVENESLPIEEKTADSEKPVEAEKLVAVEEPQNVRSEEQDNVLKNMARTYIFGAQEFFGQFNNKKTMFKEYEYLTSDIVPYINADIYKNFMIKLNEKVADDAVIESIYVKIDNMYKDKYIIDDKREPYDGRYQIEQTLNDLKLLDAYILPNNENVQDLVAYTENRVKTLKVAVEEELDAVSINDVHKANLNGIVFTSDRNIDPQTASASSYKTTFLAGEEIYAVFMADKPLNATLVNKTQPQMSINQKSDYGYRHMTVIEHKMFPVKDNQQYFVFPIVVNASNLKCNDTDAAGVDTPMMALGDLGPRKFTMRLYLDDFGQFRTSIGKIEAEFKIDGMRGDMGKIKQMAIAIKDKCGRE